MCLFCLLTWSEPKAEVKSTTGSLGLFFENFKKKIF